MNLGTSTQESQPSYSPLQILTSLSKKYTQPQTTPLAPIPEILQQSLSPASITYRDLTFLLDPTQHLRRIYFPQEYPTKLTLLSQYYKFHRNLPCWPDRPIASIMGRYYNKVKDVDYKKIKEILKREQGIELTTQQSFTSVEGDSDLETRKSRYSMVLGDLESEVDEVLRELCDGIGGGIGSKKKDVRNQSSVNFNCKGVYYTGEQKFEQYLKKQKQRTATTTRQSQPFQKKPTPPLKQLPITTNTASHPQPQHPHTKITIHKPFKKQKQEHTKPVQLGSSRSSFSHRKLASKENISHSKSKSKTKNKQNMEIEIGHRLKKVKTFHTANLLTTTPHPERHTSKSTSKLDPTTTTTTIKSKSKNKQPSRKLEPRSRSNSAYNLQVTSCLSASKVRREVMGTGIGEAKGNRSGSRSGRKSGLGGVAKGSVIELGEINMRTEKKTERSLSRQASQKTFRTDSNSKPQPQSHSHSNTTLALTQPHPHPPPQPCPHPCSNTGSTRLSNRQKIFGKKRNSVVQNMLEKKLVAFKRKQCVM